ncbi:MAG: response regulator [Candidatus Melainabacteria bacterium]|nr:response regulator [Candidatus Melainabacteria bacterium]
MQKNNTNVKTRILIADDEALIRQDVKEILTEVGYEVVAEAKDGYHALELAKLTLPDLMILDIKMPNINGLEAAEEIQIALNKRIPTVILTAYNQIELVQKAGEVGAFAFLTKPVKPQDLIASIETAKSRARELESLHQDISDLKEKLEIRKLVEKAKGLIMKKLNLDEPEAMHYLQKKSMDDRVSIKSVAEKIIREGVKA